MSDASRAGENKPPVDFEAGAVGAVGGTLLVALASNLSGDNPIRSWLVICAPSATVALRYVWSQLRFQLDEYFQQRMAKKSYENARNTLLEIRGRRGLDASFRAEIDEQLKVLHRDYMHHATSRFRKRVNSGAP